jgi:hypothetical protein
VTDMAATNKKTTPLNPEIVRPSVSSFITASTSILFWCIQYIVASVHIQFMPDDMKTID